LLGAISSVVGFWIAYEYDLPVGPTDIALLGIVYAATFLLRKVARAFRNVTPPGASVM
jgi:ABC-type Mn2+/Zn2+ transport system permease subunit